MKKEWKSISVSKEVYMLVKSKQEELVKKYNGDYVEMSYVAEKAIKEGIYKVVE